MDPQAYNKTAAIIKQLPTDIHGLRYLPTLEPFYGDDTDMPYCGWPGVPEVSDCNLLVLEECIRDLGSDLRACMEIGVNRNGERSFTQLMLKNRPQGSFYLGIDLDDKSELNDAAANTWTLQCNSHEQARVRAFLAEHGIVQLDLLFIDGWHSVNTTINDWLYADLLSPHGVVVVHDTNYHPGDIALVEAVDRNCYDVQRLCLDLHDSGIAVFRKKS